MAVNGIITGPSFNEPSNVTLGEYFFKKFQSNGDSVFLIDALTGQKVLHSQVFERSRNLAATLEDLGVRDGDVICICSENSLEFCIPVLATWYLGAIVAPVNPAQTVPELTHTIGLSNPQVIFCSSSSEAKVIEAMRNRHDPPQIITIDKTSGFGNKNMMECCKEMRRFHPRGTNNNRDKTALILCSSGTTGLPKGVMLTHFNVLCALSLVNDPEHFIEEPYIIGLLPFFHVFGLMVLLLSADVGSRIVIVMPRFIPDVFLSTIEKYRITACIVVPPIMSFLAKHPMVLKYDLSSLKSVRCGSAPLSADLEQQFSKRLKNVDDVVQGYGMTEITFAGTISPNGCSKPGSVGPVAPGLEAKVIDPEKGTILGPFQRGELCFRGSLIMKGYINNPKATNETIDSEGWLHTGDVGYYDDDGYFFIVDRIKELIKYKGFQVAPAELEAILMSHPDIEDAAVIGKPDREAGELPMAFVVKRGNITIEDIDGFVSQQVSSYKRLRGGIHFVNEIPKNPSGKILRRVLRSKL